MTKNVCLQHTRWMQIISTGANVIVIYFSSVERTILTQNIQLFVAFDHFVPWSFIDHSFTLINYSENSTRSIIMSIFSISREISNHKKWRFQGIVNNIQNNFKKQIVQLRKKFCMSNILQSQIILSQYRHIFTLNKSMIIHKIERDKQHGVFAEMT